MAYLSKAKRKSNKRKIFPPAWLDFFSHLTGTTKLILFGVKENTRLHDEKTTLGVGINHLGVPDSRTGKLGTLPVRMHWILPVRQKLYLIITYFKLTL